jgi:phage replication O-like protein O
VWSLEVFMAIASQATFQGFQFPNTTQIPNEVFDSLMSHLSGGELKVLLYICRRTFGFRKDSDSISLTQIAHGITTKAGRVLDQGTGLSKRHVINALKALEKRNIITVTRKVDATGLNEVNTYSLNLLAMGSGVGTKSPQGMVKPTSPEVVNSPSPRVVNSSAPTKQREQKKEEQKKDNVVDVTTDLATFGIAQSTITKLIQDYPVVHIKEKLAMVQGLVDARSGLVSQNPAGWLRRAIEENYTLPKTFERHLQRSGREKKEARRPQAGLRAISDVAGEQHMAKEQPQPAQTVATTPCQRPQTVVTPEKKEAEQPDQSRLRRDQRENQATWDKALEQLKSNLPQEEVAARLNGTALLEITETAARIFVPNRNALPWLERRLYSQIARAMKTVMGKDVDLQFVLAS